MQKNELRLLKFCVSYPNWHTVAKSDRAARDAMRSLIGKGLLEHSSETDQIRLAIPKRYYINEKAVSALLDNCAFAAVTIGLIQAKDELKHPQSSLAGQLEEARQHLRANAALVSEGN